MKFKELFDEERDKVMNNKIFVVIERMKKDMKEINSIMNKTELKQITKTNIVKELTTLNDSLEKISWYVRS